MAHVDFRLTEEDLVITSHRNVSQTLQAAHQGVGSIDCTGLRPLFKQLVANCPHCLRTNFESEDGIFTVKLGLISLLDQQSPCFHTISMDVPGPYKVSRFSGARHTRGNNNTSKLYCLFVVDLLTKCVSTEFMEKASSAEVVSALKSFACTHRMPRICFADCGSQLKALDNEKTPLRG